MRNTLGSAHRGCFSRFLQSSTNLPPTPSKSGKSGLLGSGWNRVLPLIQRCLRVYHRLAQQVSDGPTLKYFLLRLLFPQVKPVLNEAFSRQALCPIPIVGRRK